MSADALREHAQRLADLHFALELAVDVSPAEQRALSERILTRVGQIGFLIRQRSEPHPAGKPRDIRGPAPEPPAGDLAGTLLDNAGLLLRLLGGLLIAFALGYLARHRRAGRPAAAGAPGEGRRESLPMPLPAGGAAEGQPMTLTEIRQALRSGRTVLLQMGYEIAASRRHRFLALAAQAQEILRGIDGQTYTVWEDPGHPNRFYELLVCRRPEVLDQLASAHGPLPELAEAIEACRVPSGFSLHRAWVGALPDGQGAPGLAPAPEESLVRRGVA